MFQDFTSTEADARRRREQNDPSHSKNDAIAAATIPTLSFKRLTFPNCTVCWGNGWLTDCPAAFQLAGRTSLKMTLLSWAVLKATYKRRNTLQKRRFSFTTPAEDKLQDLTHRWLSNSTRATLKTQNIWKHGTGDDFSLGSRQQEAGGVKLPRSAEGLRRRERRIRLKQTISLWILMNFILILSAQTYEPLCTTVFHTDRAKIQNLHLLYVYGEQVYGSKTRKIENMKNEKIYEKIYKGRKREQVYG